MAKVAILFIVAFVPSLQAGVLEDLASEVENLKRNQEDLKSIQANQSAEIARVSENSAILEKLSQRGAFCGFKWEWTSANSVITYNNLLLSEGDAGTLDASSGVWTTNVPGIYMVTWSLRSRLEGDDDNWIFLYRNGKKMGESIHGSYIDKPASSSQVIGEQGGRTMLLRLDAADTLSLRTDSLRRSFGGAYFIQFCVNLVAAD